MNVFLVDDDAAVRDSLSLLIESEGYTVTVYASAEAFLAACGPELHGCVIVDLHMPGMGGLQLQEEMARRGFLLPVIFLTGYGDIPTSVKAMTAGAVDFLTKPVTGPDLLKSIAAAAAVAGRWRENASQSSGALSRLASLTDREQAVMKLVVEELSNKEIARRLGISHRTVEVHKAHVMRKTGATSFLELVEIAKAAQSGQQGREVGAVAARNESVDSGESMLRFHWKTDYVCGEPSIDQEHRKLFHLATVLLDHAIGASTTTPEFSAAFDALLSSLAEHFAHEEEILRAHRYVHLDRHAEEHKQLADRAMELRKQVDEARVSIGELVDFLVSDVVTGHMLRSDRDFWGLLRTPAQCH